MPIISPAGDDAIIIDSMPDLPCPAPQTRRFLFLQGVATPFFARLAQHLQAAGHEVHRINFSAGDAHFWPLEGAWQFRQPATAFEAYLRDIFNRFDFSDMVLFGDHRPHHRTAIALARERGTAIHVFEEGYLRPHWITLERGGVNADSALPRDPDWYRTSAAQLPAVTPIQRVSYRLSHRVGYDLRYHLANLSNPLRFPHYRSHRPDTAAAEYAGWIRRYARAPWNMRHADAVIGGLIANKTPFFLLPLQLNADIQIQVHSCFQDMVEVMEECLVSFARHATPAQHLVIKNHPFDTGFIHYARIIKAFIDHLGLDPARIHYLEAGRLDRLLPHCLGTIVVNSTVGITSLAQQVPTCALGEAVYDLPGLTHQEGLDSFWQQPSRVDHTLFRAFRKVLIHTTQVNGGFYTIPDIDMAVAGCQRLLEPQSVLSRLL